MTSLASAPQPPTISDLHDLIENKVLNILGDIRHDQAQHGAILRTHGERINIHDERLNSMAGQLDDLAQDLHRTQQQGRHATDYVRDLAAEHEADRQANRNAFMLYGVHLPSDTADAKPTALQMASLSWPGLQLHHIVNAEAFGVPRKGGIPPIKVTLSSRIAATNVMNGHHHNLPQGVAVRPYQTGVQLRLRSCAKARALLADIAHRGSQPL